MEKQNRKDRSAGRLAIRRRAELGVIAAYIHALSPRIPRPAQPWAGIAAANWIE
jgi:hypothetical protein